MKPRTFDRSPLDFAHISDTSDRSLLGFDHIFEIYPYFEGRVLLFDLISEIPNPILLLYTLPSLISEQFSADGGFVFALDFVPISDFIPHRSF